MDSTVILQHGAVLGAAVLTGYIAGRMHELGRWLSSSRRNEYMRRFGRRYFVFDATEFEIVDERTLEIIGQASAKKRPSRLRAAFMALAGAGKESK